MRLRFGVVVVACLVGLAAASLTSLTNASVSPAPPTFVVVTEDAHGFRSHISVYSSSTGKRVRTLATFSDRVFTNNGLAYAPDGSAVYFTLIPRTKRWVSLRLMRLDTATGRQSFVADGAQPAITADGTQLAYGASPGGLAIRDLATGHTRTIRLPQIRKAANLLNASIAWLGDGSDVAIVPSPTAWDLIGRPPKPRWCGISQNRSVVVFVHDPAPPAPLTARCVDLAGRPLLGRVVLAASPTSPTTLLLATDGNGDRTVVERIAKTGAITPVLTIRNSLPLSFDPSGTHLLYLVGHSPPTLTAAAIANGQLTPSPWHKPLDLGALAW